MDCDRSLHSTCIKYCDGQGIANADQVAKINEQVDARNIAFLGQTTQEGFGSTTVLRCLYTKAAQGSTPCCQRFDLAKGSIADAFQSSLLFRLICLLQTA